MPARMSAALAGYVLAKRDIPAPGSLMSGQYLIVLPPVVASKLALYTAMRETGTSNVVLAARLNRLRRDGLNWMPSDVGNCGVRFKCGVKGV